VQDNTGGVDHRDQSRLAERLGTLCSGFRQGGDRLSGTDSLAGVLDDLSGNSDREIMGQPSKAWVLEKAGDAGEVFEEHTKETAHGDKRESEAAT
jgi:hypothetical protein